MLNSEQPHTRQGNTEEKRWTPITACVLFSYLFLYFQDLPGHSAADCWHAPGGTRRGLIPGVLHRLMHFQAKVAKKRRIVGHTRKSRHNVLYFACVVICSNTQISRGLQWNLSTGSSPTHSPPPSMSSRAVSKQYAHRQQSQYPVYR